MFKIITELIPGDIMLGACDHYRAGLRPSQRLGELILSCMETGLVLKRVSGTRTENGNSLKLKGVFGC